MTTKVKPITNEFENKFKIDICKIRKSIRVLGSSPDAWQTQGLVCREGVPSSAVKP